MGARKADFLRREQNDGKGLGEVLTKWLKDSVAAWVKTFTVW